MSARLREELRREAAEARTYDVYAGSVREGRRGRRRAVAAWILLVAAVALAVPLWPEQRPPVPAADAGAVSFPDRLGLPAYGSRGVTGLGAASVVYTGYGGRFGPLFDDADRYALVGATREDYRTFHTGPVDDDVMLSPDGTVLAVPDRLIDLRTGNDQRLIGAPLAWSPDGTWLVTLGDRLRIVDARTGGTSDLAPAGGQSSAAWSPDGTRFAYTNNGRLSVSDATGRTIGSFPVPPDAQLAGKGAWTPDGRTVAVSTSPERWSPRWFDVATGREVDGPRLPAVDGAIYGSTLLGWRPDGSALVFLRAEQPRLLALTPGAARPVTAMTLPSEVYYVDIADRAVHSDRVRAGDPPFLIGPGMWAKLAGLTLLVVAVAVAVRWLREQARTHRVKATPWGTTHGPLV